MGLDNSSATPCCCPSHCIPNNKYCNNEVTFCHCIFLFPFHLIYIVWPNYSIHVFSTLLMNGLLIKDIFNNPLWNRAAFLYTALLWVQLPVHTVQLVYVCECQCNELNADDAADHLHTSLTPGAVSILYPFFITFSSFPFNLCRQGRHQSDWQVVWSAFRAWWKKESCQHKYPSWILSRHGAAMATMNLHPLSQAEKHEPISMAENLAVTRRRHPLPRPPLCKQHDQYCQFIACSFACSLCPFLFPDRQIM